MYDLHCHILPGVDDGARDMVESLDMLRAAKAVGIDTLVCTPHCNDGFNYEAVQAAYAAFAPQAQAMGINAMLGYEVNWKKLGEVGIENARYLVFEGTDLFLLEFSNHSLPPNWRGVVQALQRQGLQVIIAHPERYQAVQRDPGIAAEMRSLGCLLQLSANFVSGSRGASKQAAMTLLRADLVDYIASDAHCAADYRDFDDALRLARRV